MKNLLNLNQLSVISRDWTENGPKTDREWTENRPTRLRVLAKYAAMLLLLLTLGVGQMWADNAGFWDTGAGIITYSKNGASDTNHSVNKTGSSTSDFGTVTAFWLKGWQFKMWKNNGGNVCDFGKLYYRIYLTSGSGGSYTELNKNNTQWNVDGNNIYHNGGSLNTNLLSGLVGGEYYFEFYFQAQGNWNSGSGCNNQYLNNGGSNYKIKFKYDPKFTVTVAAGSNGSVAKTSVTAGNIDAVTLPTATANTGYHFNNWTTASSNLTLGNTTSATAGTVKARAAGTVTANFAENTYSLTFSHNGHGTIAVGGATVSSGSTASVNYYTTKTLVATPSTGYNFSGWTKSGSNTSAVTIGNASNASTTIKATNTGATITAGFTPKTYSITLDGNGGSDGSATATYNSSTLTSVTGCSRASYDLNGYYTATSGGTKIINANGSLVASTSYTDGSGNWTYDADVELHAQWTYNPVTYSVTYAVGTGYTSYGSLSAKNTSTSAAISSGSSLESGTGVTFTATPNTGYVVEGWYTNAACTSGKHDAGSTTYSTTLSGNITVYVKFVEKTWSVAFAAGTGGTVTTPNSTPRTVGQITGISIAATPSSGYTFNRWTITSGSGSFTSSATTNSNKFKPTAASTITASFTETMRTITINGGTAASTTAGVATTGSATAAAPAAGKKFTGWTLGDGVTLSGGALTDRTINFTATANSSVTANYADRASVKMYFAKPTTLSWSKVYAYAWKSSDGSVKNANYPGIELVNTEVINCVTYYTYQYYTEGDGIGGEATGNSAWNKIIFGDNNDARKTGDLNIADGHYYYRATDENTSGKTAAITSAWYIKGTMNSWGETDPITHNCATNSGSVDISLTTGSTYEFKVYNEVNNQMWSNSTACGQGDGITATMASAETLYNNDANVMKITPALNGTYTFTVGSTNASNPTIKVTFPEIYAIVGSFNSWNTETNPLAMVGNTGTANIVLSPSDTNYELKVVDDGAMYGKNSTTITGSTTVSSMAVGQSNIALKADIYPASANPSYGFSYNKSTKALTVTYPAAHTVTYGVGTHAGTTSVTSSISVASGKKILDSQSITFSKGDTKTGYTWKGWYNNTSGSSSALGTGTTYTSSSRAANTSVYACYNLVTYTITYNLNGGSNPVSPAPATSFTIESSAITLPTPTRTGYTFNGWYANSDLSTGGVKTTIPAGSTGNKTYWAKWTPITYTISFNGNGKTSGTMSNQTGVVYDSETTITANAFVKTGYTFAGWSTSKSRADAGTIDRADGAAHGNLTSTNGATVTLYASWTPKQSAITLDKQTSATGYYSSGTVSTSPGSATYGSAMPTLSGTMPTAAAGYKFMGFYDGTSGSGTKYYNADGSSARNWDKDKTTGTTLYAYYKPAAITALTFDAASVEASGAVGVTPTIDPVPEPTVSVCWRVLYDNDNPLSPQPEITWNGTKASFTAPAASGTYKVEAKLYNSGSCGSGTLLSTRVQSFTVAGVHTVTVQYKCGEDDIKASTTTTGRPFDWSGDITAPDIFGYTFSGWTAGDGITIKDGESSTATTHIKATYNGTLTANYTQKSLIYFKNTLGWSDVYVNFYTASDWDSSDNGSGSQKGAGNNGVTNRNKHMTQIGSTDVWYYDYGYNDGGSSITPSLYVSFTSASQNNVNEFWAANPGIGVVYPANYPDAISTDKSSENGFKAATPMFVPLATQDAVAINVGGGGKANYYNAGYWTKYLPGTGYTLEIYNSGGSYLKSAEFTSGDELMPMKAVVDLEAGQTYKFQLRRGGTDSYGIYYGNSGTMTYANHGQGIAWEMINTMSPSFTKCGITTNAAGDYTFNLSYSGNSSTPPQYRLRMEVDYPVATGDYRVIYKHTGQANYKASAIVQKVNNGKDTVSFFIKPGSSPSMKIQRATVSGGGVVSWSDYSTISSSVSGLAKDSVYNICLTMNGSGAISVENVEVYTGNFYIRTDAANSKWDNYRSDPDHLMTFSEYSITHGGYSHYYCHWVQAGTNRKNVKFCIANDYSPSISDTLAREPASGTWANIASFISEGGDILSNANVRFTWNQHDNTISRAYIDGAQEDGSEFLVLLNVESGADKIKKSDGTALSGHKVTFSDNENWIYEANVKAQPKAAYRLISTWGTGGTVITQYFKGSSTTTETLIDGSGSTWYDIRLLYDFKTNRLVAAWVPSDATITSNNAINADVMFIREHQGDIAQLTFTASGQISAIKTAYGVLKFNKWTLANKEKTGGHSPLAKPASVYERSLFWISFPFRVKLSEVFGFGTYGTHWAIQRYDGAKRAEIGHFAENGSFWRWMSRNTEYLEPNQGYLLAIDLDLLGESSDVWGPESRSSQIELYFPSYGDMPNISNASVAQTIPSHECTINRATGVAPLLDTGDPRTSYNRTIFDSHWNVLSVPTYVNTTAVSYANTTWTAAIGPKFLYTWNASDNTITATTASGYTYHAMHSYMVQYAGNLTWTASSGSPASIVARKTYAETPKEVEFRLELQQNEQEIDRTFVVLSNDEEVSADFQFGEDMTKEFNAKKSAIYTFIADEAVAAGNTLPMSEQITVVPVGVDIKADGDYTFAMPDGTSGVGVVLIDNETGIRTSLSALDYTVFLEAGTYDKRFMMEISPIKQGTTGIDMINGDASANGVRKLLIDQKMYIIKGDKMYDATGRRVE